MYGIIPKLTLVIDEFIGFLEVKGTYITIIFLLFYSQEL